MLYRIFTNQNKLDSNVLQAINEYTKRLSPYCNIELFTSKDINKIIASDTQSSYKIIVNKSSDTISSEDFALKITYLTTHGNSTIDFYIGAEPNRYDDILTISNANISVPTLTNILYEQIYRAYMINIGKTYHK